MANMMKGNDDAVSTSVIELPLEESLEAITAVIHAEASKFDNSHEILSEVVSAMQQEQQCDEIRSNILTCDIDLSPHTYPFMIFRQVRIAELLLKNPAQTHAYLRTEAKNEAYNVGLQDQLELLDVLASDPEVVLKGFMVALAEDENQKRFGKCSLREICCIMAHFVDNYNPQICAIYQQYRSVPTWDEIEAAVETKRSVRKQVAKDLV